MSAALLRLPLPEGLPAPDAARVGPHRARLLEGRVLATTDSGAYAWLTPEEYRSYLGGLEPGGPLWERLRPLGLVRDYQDFDALAEAGMETSLLAWSGPRNHVVFAERGGSAMDPETAAAVVDFACLCPAPILSLELAGDLEAGWPAAWLLVQYARRRAEWNTRLLLLSARVGPEGLGADKLEFLLSNGVGLRVCWPEPGAPPEPLHWLAKALRSRRPEAPAPRALVPVGAKSRDAQGWVERLREGGFGSVRFQDTGDLLRQRGEERFLTFYEQALDALLAVDGPREERAIDFLRRIPAEGPAVREERPAPLAGLDVLAELAYDPEGRIYTSAEGLALAEAGEDLFRVGDARYSSFEELGGKEAVAACLAGVEGDHQPLCSQCAYKPYCSLPPGRNHRMQGTLWGRHASSPLCRLHMGVLDMLFSRLAAEGRERLLEWARTPY